MAETPGQVTVTATLADALGALAGPLASVIAHWAKAPKRVRAAVRRVYPALAGALDELTAALQDKLGPI